MRIALFTDQHFGPAASFHGKLRKLSHHAAALTERFVDKMQREVQPDLVVNLGDVLEDESEALDTQRYQQFLGILAPLACRVEHVIGNHDSVYLSDETLARMLGTRSLYRSVDVAGVHVVVLRSVERKDRDVRLPDEQLRWLEADLDRASLPTVVCIHHPLSDLELTGNRWFEKAPHICRVANRREVRALLERSGRVRAVFNGHAHWNHLDVVGGIPYVTLQSLVENVDDDAPGRAAAAHAVVDISPKRLLVDVFGEHPAHYQFDGPAAS
ncbi:MAG TPA: metallophosphoesterase [Polyangiaceae bacterium]